MDRLIDEIITVNITDVSSVAVETSVNTVAVLGVATKEGAKTEKHTSYGSVSEAYGKNCDLAKVAKSFFMENNPGVLVCIPSASAITAANVEELLDSAMEGGYHVIVRLGADVSKDAAKDIVDKIEGWCLLNFRMGHVEIEDKSVAFEVCRAYTAEDAKAPTRVAIYAHNESEELSLAAAIVATRCATDPARGTWAHKTLQSVSPDAYSRNEFSDAKSVGLNIYCKVAGLSRTFFGSTAGANNAFIDEVVKKDWIKFRSQEAVFNILGNANAGDGVDYNNDGIDSIVSSINSIFTIAADNSHRYVLPDSFEVQAPKYEDIPAAERKIRNLPSVKTLFGIQSSIHTVKTIEMQVV
jgi:hypothetical protein